MLRAIAIAAAVVLAVVLFVVLRPSGDDEPAPTTTPATTGPGAEPPQAEPGPTTTVETVLTVETPVTQVNVRVRGGRPVGGAVDAEVERGDTVVLVVSSDAADHVHVHGYDLFEDVGPGKQARIRFVADAPGRFEVELEDRGVPIAELTVR